MDADVVKIATRAHSIADAMKVLQVAAEMETPTIAIAVGELGSFTRVLGAKYGAPFTYANFNVDRSFAAGMLRFDELRRDYAYDSDRRPDRGLRRHRRPDRPQPQPAGPQRRLPERSA